VCDLINRKQDSIASHPLLRHSTQQAQLSGQKGYRNISRQLDLNSQAISASFY
jgi:hypothetical protein